MHYSVLCKMMANTFHYVTFNVFWHSVAKKDLGNQSTVENKEKTKTMKKNHVRLHAKSVPKWPFPHFVYVIKERRKISQQCIITSFIGTYQVWSRGEIPSLSCKTQETCVSVHRFEWPSEQLHAWTTSPAAPAFITITFHTLANIHLTDQ